MKPSMVARDHSMRSFEPPLEPLLLLLLLFVEVELVAVAAEDVVVEVAVVAEDVELLLPLLYILLERS